MYSDFKSIQHLVSLLKQYSIKHIVFGAGTRHVAIIQSMQSDTYFKCYSVVDERSAAFFALGLIQKIKEPVAVCCTSGTSVANFGPALIEAYYQNLPLIAITADRQIEKRGQLEDQTIPQNELFNVCLRKSVHLPVIENKQDEWYVNRLINEALIASIQGDKGPVQINITIPQGMKTFDTILLPVYRKIQFSGKDSEDIMWENFANYFLNKKIIVVYSQIPLISPRQQEILNNFIDKFNVLVLCDHLSNCHSKNSITWQIPYFPAFLKKIEVLKPDVIITFKGNYMFKDFVNSNLSRGVRHIHCSSDGVVQDQYEILTDVVEYDVFKFLELVNRNSKLTEKQDNSFFDTWNNVKQQVSLVDNLPWSDIYAVGECLKKIPNNSSLHLGNSQTVRFAHYFPIKESVEVYCNRGTNGIDGSLSTAMGAATVSKELFFLIIGDLSFFYDMNGLWNRHIGKNVRIMLNNNACGEVLYFVGDNIHAKESFNSFYGANHNTSAKGWAESVGFEYMSANNDEEYNEQINKFVSADNNMPILFEVFTKLEENEVVLNSIKKEYGRTIIEKVKGKMRRFF